MADKRTKCEQDIQNTYFKNKALTKPKNT